VSADPESFADIEKIGDFCQGVAAPLIEAGAFFSRPHGSWAEPAMKRASTSFLVYQRMKDIFDPDHVLAPGRLMLGGASDGQA
jgi:FAD/FMN-containing dehydrogenase